MSDYYGLPTGFLENETIRLEYLLTAGPRIVRLSLRGGPNLLAEVPDIRVETHLGPFYFRGGHRLWRSPELMPETYFPDNHGLNVEDLSHGIKLTQLATVGTEISKSMEIRLGVAAPKLTVRHELRNEGTAPLVLAPWALTMFRLGGTAILPQPGGSDESNRLLNNRILALWPYTRINDPRLILRDDFILIRAVPDLPPVKLGYRNPRGWLAYWLDGILFRKTFEAQPGAIYPDGGCNSEAYCNDQFMELESLGPLSGLEPGQSVSLLETWELFDRLDQPFLPEDAHALFSPEQ
jgi:hypothetical protein